MLVDTISKVKNVTFDATNLDAYVTSLRGLSATQAKVVLSSASLDKAQQKQILNKLAETTATVSLTSAEASEALARKLGSQEAANSLLKKAGLVTEKELETGVTIALKKELVEEAIALGKITQEEGKQLLTTFGLTGGNVGLATSFKLLASQIWESIKAMGVWLVTTPTGVFTLIAGSLAVATLAVTKYNEKLEESRQKMIEAGKEASQLNKDLDGLVEEYRKLGEDGELDNSDREQAKNIQQQINDLLGDEVSYIDLANGKYEAQLKTLQKIQHEKAKDNHKTIRDAKVAAEDSLLAITPKITSGFNNTADESKAIKQVLKDYGFDKYIGTSENDNSASQIIHFAIDNSSAESTIQSLEDMKELRDVLRKSYEDEISTGGDLEDFYNNLDKKIGELSGAVTKYKDALSNYNINEAVIQFNETEFDGVTGALIKNEEQLNKWISSMLSSQDISDGVKKELIGLANTYFPDMSDAIKKSTQEYIKSQVAAGGDVVKLKDLATACGITTNEYVELIAQEVIFNNANLDVSDKVSKLAELQQALGVTTSAAIGLNNALAGRTIDSRLEMGMAMHQYGIKRTGKGYEYNGKVYKSGKDAVNAAMLDDLKKNLTSNVPKVETPYSPTDGDKNKPDYEDPTDAIVNRINLRAKELEQQEESIQNAIEIAELENDYKKQISLTNDLINTRRKRVEELNKANTGLHNEAEYLRNSNPWDEESWFDSQGNATEAYYALYNSSSKADQEKIKNVFEAISKIKKAWVENDEELVNLNKQLLQDAEKLNDLYSTQHENTIRDIEHTRDMALEANPFTDTTSYYKQMQEEYHKEAERLRALDPEKYKEEIQELQMAWHEAQNSIVDWRWENSQNWINQRNAYNDWNLFGDSEMQAWERVVKWLKKEYPNELDKIREAEQSLFEARKEEFNKANDFASSFIDSQKTLLQSYFDTANAIAEAQHDINKELEASKTMYEYLDEDTRKLLFNQEDYNTLSKELIDIQSEADRLQRQYTYDLENSTLSTIEEITSNYEMQYEMLMKSYEIAKADLEVAKKKAKLNNVLNERNVRMFVNGQWQWVANTQDVINAKSELADAEYARKTAQATKEQTESINNLTKQQDELGTTIKLFENGVIDLTTAVGKVKDIFGELPSYIKSAFSNISYSVSGSQGSSSSSKSWGAGKSLGSSSSNASATIPGVGVVPVHVNSAGKTTTSGLPAGTVVHTSNGDYKIKGGTGGNYDAEKIKKHASGTRYTPGGLTALGEIEDEMFIDNNGHLIPINQPTIGNIGSGGIVFNQDQMDFVRKVWDWSNIGTVSHNLVSRNMAQTIDKSVDNRIIINGMTVDSGSADGQALINALRRYVGNH